MAKERVFYKTFWRIILRLPFFFLFLTSSFASDNNPIALPSDLITFEKICNEYRVILNLKFQDMRKTFLLKEVQPGEIHFLNKNQEPQAIIHFFHEMNPEKTKKIEKVRITNHTGDALLEEETITMGHNLQFTDPQKLIFFDSDYSNNHTLCSLSEEEDSKQVKISSQDKPQFETITQRMNGTGESILSHELTIGSTHVLTIRDINKNNPAQRMYEYNRKQTDFQLGAFGHQFSSNGGDPGKMWLVGEKKENHIIPNFKYYSQFLTNRGIRGDLSLNEFLNEINDRVYIRYFKNDILKFLDSLTANTWPKTEKSINVAANSRFLDELKILRQRADDAQTNPSLLVQIKTKLLEFIAAIQDGSLQVNDSRK